MAVLGIPEDASPWDITDEQRRAIAGEATDLPLQIDPGDQVGLGQIPAQEGFQTAPATSIDLTTQATQPAQAQPTAPAAPPTGLDVSRVAGQDPAGTIGAPGAGGMRAPRLPGVGVSTKPLREARERVQDIGDEAFSEYDSRAKLYRDAADKERAATAAKTGAQWESAQVQEDIMQSGVEKAERLQVDHAQRVNKAQADVDTKMGQYEQARQEFAASRIDPDGFYKEPDGSTNYGKKIGAAVAIALGSMASRLPGRMGGGGPNTALKMIQTAIQRNIRGQEVNLQKKGQAVGMAQTEVGMARNLFSDATSQALAAENAHWQHVQHKIQQAMMGSKSQEILATGQQLQAAIVDKVNQNEAQLKQGELATRLKTASTEARIAGTEIGLKQKGRQLELQRAAAQRTLEAKAAQVQKPDVMPPGTRLSQESIRKGFTPNKKDRGIIKEAMASYNPAKTGITKLIAWRVKYGAEKMDRTAMAEGAAIAKGLILELKVMEKMGAHFTEMEKELLGITENPGDIGFVLTTLRTIDQRIDDKIAGRLNAYGLDLDRSTGSRKRN